MNVYVVAVQDVAHHRWRYVVIAPSAYEADRIATEHRGNPWELSSSVGWLGKYEPGMIGEELARGLGWPIIAIDTDSAVKGDR